jgi:hypothetical protein
MFLPLEAAIERIARDGITSRMAGIHDVGIGIRAELMRQKLAHGGRSRKAGRKGGAAHKPTAPRGDTQRPEQSSLHVRERPGHVRVRGVPPLYPAA